MHMHITTCTCLCHLQHQMDTHAVLDILPVTSKAVKSLLSSHSQICTAQQHCCQTTSANTHPISATSSSHHSTPSCCLWGSAQQGHGSKPSTLNHHNVPNKCIALDNATKGYQYCCCCSWLRPPTKTARTTMHCIVVCMLVSRHTPHTLVV